MTRRPGELDEATVAIMRKGAEVARASALTVPPPEASTPTEQRTPGEERDDGMRFKCRACESYVKPDPEGQGMTCDNCSEWFTLCDGCMPEVDAYSNDAVWLCPECR